MTTKKGKYNRFKMIIGANLRFGGSGGTSNGTRTFSCPPSSSTEAGLLYLIAVLGVVTNVAVMILILGRASLRRLFFIIICRLFSYDSIFRTTFSIESIAGNVNHSILQESRPRGGKKLNIQAALNRIHLL